MALGTRVPTAYVDESSASDVAERKSVRHCFVMVGSVAGSWPAREKVVALSSIEGDCISSRRGII